MTSEEIRILIPQYLAGQSTASEKVLFEAQLDANAELRQELEELRPLWDELGSLPQEEPSAALRARFYQKLNDANTGRSRPFRSDFAWWKPGLAGLVRQAAVALAVFALGLYVGHAKMSTQQPPVAGTDEVKRLGTEVQSLRQTVALSLLERQSATSRLEGISWSNRVEHPDQDLVAALLTVLNHDSNINVRLSALDALGKFTDEPQVRSALVNAIPHQDSPLVQIALIDALVHMRDGGAAKELRKLKADTDANPAVRQRAAWGLQKLSYQ
jgi:HEAT repeat protein